MTPGHPDMSWPIYVSMMIADTLAPYGVRSSATIMLTPILRNTSSDTRGGGGGGGGGGGCLMLLNVGLSNPTFNPIPTW